MIKNTFSNLSIFLFISLKIFNIFFPISFPMGILSKNIPPTLFNIVFVVLRLISLELNFFIKLYKYISSIISDIFSFPDIEI